MHSVKIDTLCVETTVVIIATIIIVLTNDMLFETKYVGRLLDDVTQS